MNLKKTGIAGTFESSDVFVEAVPSDDTLDIQLNSTVASRFGKHIRSLVMDIAKEMKVSKGLIKIQDKGALDCTISARVKTAILRATDSDYDWEKK